MWRGKTNILFLLPSCKKHIKRVGNDIDHFFRQCACAKYSTVYQEWYIANARHNIRMSFIIFPSILVYNCNDNTVFLVSCVHDFFFISLWNRKNAPTRFDQVYIHYLYNVVCQITMSHLMMNVHTCVTDNTTYTILYVRSLCLI